MCRGLRIRRGGYRRSTAFYDRLAFISFGASPLFDVNVAFTACAGEHSADDGGAGGLGRFAAFTPIGP